MSNQGSGPQIVYGLGVLDGVTVNALIVDHAAAENGLVAWFGDEVLHGPGAF